MEQEFTLRPRTKKFILSGFLYLIIVFGLNLGLTKGLSAQTYIQVPAIGGIPSPSYPQVPYFGPISSLNVRAASLYRASDFINLPAGAQITSLGFKLNGQTTGMTQGTLDIYLIPTTDTVYNLSTNWNNIIANSNILQVYNSLFAHWTQTPISGYLDFNFNTPFSLLPGEGFYLISEWDQGILWGVNAAYECNITLPNSHYYGTNNSHSPQTPPTTLNQSSNYRHVLRLGYNSPTGISEMNSNNAINVYPNPTREILNVDLSKFKNAVTQATLRDLTGKVVKTECLKNKENQISLTGISPGIYSLHLASGSETVVKRIIIK